MVSFFRWLAGPLVGGLALVSGSASAVGIQGEIHNGAALAAAGGSDTTLVLLTNLIQGKFIGLGTLEGSQFRLTVPVSFKPLFGPLNACVGVSSSPSEPNPNTDIAEPLMLLSPARNAVALLTQADDPRDPTCRAQWMHRDRAATVKGRCSGLSTYYDLTLRAGWNAVMTVGESGKFLVHNAAERLP